RCVAIHDDEVRGVRRIVERNEVERREAGRAVGECALQTHGVERAGPEIRRDVHRIRLGARLQYHRYRITQERKLGKYRRQLRDLGVERGSLGLGQTDRLAADGSRRVARACAEQCRYANEATDKRCSHGNLLRFGERRLQRRRFPGRRTYTVSRRVVPEARGRWGPRGSPWAAPWPPFQNT